MKQTKFFQHANRDSNLELLRIVAMAFIVLHHMIVCGLQLSKFVLDPPSLFSSMNTTQSYFLLVANSFLVIGVNLFVLISGYYGIKLKWKSLLNYTAICYFYALIYCFTPPIPDPKHIVIEIFGVNLFMFTWFLPCYLTLMLISPLINAGIEKLSNRQFLYTLLGVMLAIFWFGFVKNNNRVADTHSFVQMLLIYIIGRGLNRFKNICKVMNYKSYNYLITYILTSLFLGLICVLFYQINQPKYMWLMYSYINPLVVLSSVSLFLFFTKISIKSKLINWAATSVFAILFLQGFDRYVFTESIYKEYGLFSWTTLGLYSLIFVVAMTVPILVDQVRIFLFTPIVDWLVPKCQKIQSFVESKLRKLFFYNLP